MKAIFGRPARFLSVVISLVALSMLGTSAGWAQQKSLKEQLFGAWTLVSSEVTPKGGTKQLGFGGPNPKGILIFDAGGRYASVTGRPDRPKFKPSTNLRADTPAAEFGEAARGFGANFGTWSVNEADKSLIRKYEIALIPNNDRNETKASVSLSKGELKLVQVSAAGAKTESVYQRAK